MLVLQKRVRNGLLGGKHSRGFGRGTINGKYVNCFGVFPCGGLAKSLIVVLGNRVGKSSAGNGMGGFFRGAVWFVVVPAVWGSVFASWVCRGDGLVGNGLPKKLRWPSRSGGVGGVVCVTSLEPIIPAPL